MEVRHIQMLRGLINIRSVAHKELYQRVISKIKSIVEAGKAH
jgi:hypothetical protein